MTSTARIITAIAATALTAGGTGLASAQDYPNKPVRLFASTAGGGTDLVARVLAQGLSSGFGQPIIVENRAAFNSIETVSKAAPDGYTLLVMGVPAWLTPFMQDNVPWDAVRDFQAVTTLTKQPTFLVVHSSLPVASVKELIALARSKPGQLNYSSGGTGTSSHLSAELFTAMAKVKITRINYKGAAQATTDLLAGQVQLMFANPTAVAPHVRSGKLKALGVSSAKPSPLNPAVPPIAQTLPEYELVEILGLLAPSKTPPAIIQRWNQAAARSLDNPDLKQKFLSMGSELATSSPEEFAAAIKSDIARLGKILQETRTRE